MWLMPDVSHWQGHHTREDMVQAATVASSILFKATQGNGFIDPEFRSNVEAANGASLPWGAYHFVDTVDEGDGIEQAEHFWRVASSVPNLRFLLIDWERAWRPLALDLSERLRILAGDIPVGDYIGSHARSQGGQLPDMDFHMVPQYGPAQLDPRYKTDPLSAWQYCADTATEILTERGWLNYLDVTVNDRVLTLNRGTGLAEWQQPSAINRFLFDGSMLSLEGRAHSSLTTLDHRWPTTDGSLVQSKDLSGRDHLVLAAPCADLPETPKYADAFVEAMAWYWTEGWPTNGSKGGLYISQSATKSPASCSRIRSSLHQLFGPPVQKNDTHGHGVTWAECRQSNGMIKFRLSKMAAVPFHEAAPDRVVSLPFIMSLTTAQLRLFVDASIAADGWSTPSHTGISQSAPERLDALELAYILLGTPLTRRAVTGRNRGERLSLLRRSYVRAEVGGGGTTGDGLTARKVVPHRGIVWCPTTPNSTWLARRNGTTYFTGNTNGEVNGTDWPSGVPGIGKCDMSAVFRPEDFGFGGDMATLDLSQDIYPSPDKNQSLGNVLREMDDVLPTLRALVANVDTWDDKVIAALRAALSEELSEMELGDLSVDEVANRVAQRLAERLSA